MGGLHDATRRYTSFPLSRGNRLRGFMEPQIPMKVDGEIQRRRVPVSPGVP